MYIDTNKNISLEKKCIFLSIIFFYLYLYNECKNKNKIVSIEIKKLFFETILLTFINNKENLNIIYKY